MKTAFLLRAALGAAVLGLAGCGGGGSPADAGNSATPLGVAASGAVTVAPSAGIGTVVSAARSSASMPQRPGVLSISTSPRLEPFPTSSAAYDALKADAQALAYGAGARGQIATYTWHELEPAPGSFDPAKLAELQAAIDHARANALVQYVGLQLINSYVKELPADLAGLAFDDPQVTARFHGLLQRIVGNNVGRIRYLSIGNEVDLYLAGHGEDAGHYLAFYRDAAAFARALDPALQVGVTGSGAGALGAQAALLRGLNAFSDVVMLTYYPTQADASGAVTVRDPSVVAGELARLLAFAGAKPLVLQEVGYPASPLIGSSEARQAEFLRQVFAAWGAAGGRIPFVNVFLLHDFPSWLCDSLLAYYGLGAGGAGLQASLCSLGLRTVDGTPRQAWATLLDQAQRSHLP